MGIFIYYQVITQMKNLSRASNNNTFDQWIGAEAPDITITTLDGKSIVLSQFKGKRVVLDFWATWCGPCVKEMPYLERLNNESSRDDLVIIGISKEDETTIRSFVAQKDVNYSFASSNNLPSPYKDIRAIPTKFFIDRKGIVQSVRVGSLNFDQLKEQALTADYQGIGKSSPGESFQIPDQIDLESSLSSADPWVGIWKLNPEKSKLQSALPLNFSEIRVMFREIDPATMEITLMDDLENGSSAVRWKCTIPQSGGIQNYQQGSPGMNTTIVDTVIDDLTQYLTYLQDGKQYRIVKLVLSEDGRTYTLSCESVDTMGRPFDHVEVYEKQQTP